MSSQYHSTLKPKKPSYIAALDGIRAIALILVLFAHSVIFDQFILLHNIGVELGHLGVCIFFVLSGYLITRSLIQEEEKTGSISLKFFYIRRALRLLPALWVYILVVWILWIGGLLPGNPWHSFITSLLYIRNLIGHGDATNHIWSLSVEEQFYFLWPLAIIPFRQRNLHRLFIAIIVICIVVFWRYYALTNHLARYGDAYMRTDFRFDSPLIGCAIALLEKIKPRVFVLFNLSSFRSDIWLLTGIILLIYWLMFDLQYGNILGITSTATSLIAAIIISSQIANNNSIGQRFLTLPPLVFIGKISYGVYLWQGLFLGFQASPIGFIRKFPIDIILSFSVAAISYYFLEKPLLKIKDKYFNKDNLLYKNQII